ARRRCRALAGGACGPAARGRGSAPPGGHLAAIDRPAAGRLRECALPSGAQGDVMTWSRADLHMHTTCSDGMHSPAQLAERLAESGLAVAAVTDHDTIEGAL